MKALGVGTALIVLVALSALLDDETGLGIWRELRADLERSEARVERLARENEGLRREIAALESQPEAVERAIREELDLALEGEIVVHFEAPGEGPPSRSGALGSAPREERQR